MTTPQGDPPTEAEIAAMQAAIDQKAADALAKYLEKITSGTSGAAQPR